MPRQTSWASTNAMKGSCRYFAFCPTLSLQGRVWILRAISNSRQVGVRPAPLPQRPSIGQYRIAQQENRPIDPDNHATIIGSCEGDDTRPTIVSRGISRSTSKSLDLYQLRGKITAAGRQRKWKEVLRLLGRWERQHQSKKLDAKTYNFALSALGKCGRWREAIATLNRMRDRRVQPDAYSWNTAISACGRAGQWEQALRLLGSMEEEGSEARPDIFSYNIAIDAVAKAGRWMKALELLERMGGRGLTPDVISFTSAMSACVKAGEWQRALDIMDLMLEQGVEPNIISYGTAISACARGGCCQKALCLLREIPSRGLVANAYVYGSAVHACVKAGEHERALSLLGEMVEVGVVPDAVAFTAAMTAVDGWAAALHLLEIMKRAGVAPDTTAYNAALSVIARCGREDVALALLEQMKADGCSPDLVSFNAAINACASRGKWQEAARLLEVEMPAAKVKPDVISFTSVIHACSGPAGNWEKAYQLLDGMWQDDTGPKPNKRTYDLVIQACGHGGEWELGVALMDDMRDLGIKLDVQTFNIATAACARAGESLAAETVVATMRRSGVAPDEFSYASLVAACGRSGEWERAVEIFDEARYVRQVRPSLPMYGALLSALADAKQWGRVLLYWDRMVADGIVPDAMAACKGALAAAELGDGHGALSLLEGKPSLRVRGGSFRASEAQTGGRLAGEIPFGATANGDDERGTGPEGDSLPGGWEAATPSLLNAVLHALDRMGEDSAVLETVERGREKGVKLNAGVYRSALKACGNLGDHSRAISLLARMMERERLTPDVVHWNHALRAAAAAARWREARALLEDMKASDVSPDEFSYTMALKACSASWWPGDSRSNDSEWLTKEGVHDEGQNKEASKRVTRGAEAKDCSDQEDRVVLRAGRARNAVELLQEMRRVGLHVSERSFNLAMAACLEGHGGGPTETKVGTKPHDGDNPPAMTALRLFDQLVDTGATPTGLTYRLALKTATLLTRYTRSSAEVEWAGSKELWWEALRRGM